MKKYWLAVCLLCCFTSVAFASDVITLRADIWEPYNSDPGSAKPGFMIDVAKAIFSKAGYTVDYQCKGWTWDRSIEEARQGRIDAIVGASEDDAPDFIFPDFFRSLSSQPSYLQAHCRFLCSATKLPSTCVLNRGEGLKT